MALWFFFLLPLFAVGEAQPTNLINQTDLLTAMADMRAQSYHGFVILLKIVNGSLNSQQNTDITFLMPNDKELSEAALSPDRLQDFMLSHSIPRALLLNNLLQFPNGTIVPSSVPDKMLSITNTGRSGLFVNNAKIVTPNVCRSSLIRCHGISTAITFDNIVSLPAPLPDNLRAPESVDSLKWYGGAKSSPSVHLKKTPPLH